MESVACFSIFRVFFSQFRINYAKRSKNAGASVLNTQRRATYLESLQAWVTASKRHGSRATTALFAAIRDDVLTAVLHGYSLRTIWEHMRETGRYPGTYETFRRHARRARMQGGQPQSIMPPPRSSSVQRVTHPPPAAVMPPPKPAATPRDDIGGFTMNRKTDKELI